MSLLGKPQGFTLCTQSPESPWASPGAGGPPLWSCSFLPPHLGSAGTCGEAPTLPHLRRPVVLNQEQFCPPKDMWWCLETFCIVVTRRLLLAPSELRPKMVLNDVLKCIGWGLTTKGLPGPKKKVSSAEVEKLIWAHLTASLRLGILHIHIHTHTYTHTHIHACAHTYTHTCIHTHTHTEDLISVHSGGPGSWGRLGEHASSSKHLLEPTSEHERRFALQLQVLRNKNFELLTCS